MCIVDKAREYNAMNSFGGSYAKSVIEKMKCKFGVDR